MTRLNVRILYLSLAALLVLLAACGEDDIGADPPTATPAPAATATPEPTPTTAPQEGVLTGTEWVLAEIDGTSALDETQVTLEFTAEGVDGYSGCNWYGGAVEISDDRLRFDDLAMTLRLCAPDSINEQEQRYHELLRDVEGYEATETRLTLLTAGGATALVFEHREVAAMDPADLIDTTWLLTSFDDVPASGPPGLLMFDDASRFSTRDGCYNISGDYTANGDHLVFPTSNANAHTCLQPLEMQTHAASLTSAIGDVAYYRISDDGDELQLMHYDGRTATFSRVTETPPDDAWAITWVLDSIVEAGVAEPPIEGTEITLRIQNPSLQIDEGQAVIGVSGCNTYHATMTAGVDTLTFSDMIMTDMGCVDPPGAMDQEQRYLDLLGQVSSHNTYEAGALQLITQDGTTLVFHPEE